MPKNWLLYVLVLGAGLVSIFVTLNEHRQPQHAVIKHVLTIVAVSGILIAFADHYIIWRTTIDRRVHAAPNLRRTWDTTAAIQHSDPARNRTFDAYVVFKQTGTHVRLTALWHGGKTSIMPHSVPIVANVGAVAFTGGYRIEPQGALRETGMFFPLSCSLCRPVGCCIS
jgi:hypothetical protein